MQGWIRWWVNGKLRRIKWSTDSWEHLGFLSELSLIWEHRIQLNPSQKTVVFKQRQQTCIGVWNGCDQRLSLCVQPRVPSQDRAGQGTSPLAQSRCFRIHLSVGLPRSAELSWPKFSPIYSVQEGR
jgi:hypothetical protein